MYGGRGTTHRNTRFKAKWAFGSFVCTSKTATRGRPSTTPENAAFSSLECVPGNSSIHARGSISPTAKEQQQARRKACIWHAGCWYDMAGAIEGWLSCCAQGLCQQLRSSYASIFAINKTLRSINQTLLGCTCFEDEQSQSRPKHVSKCCWEINIYDISFIAVPQRLIYWRSFARDHHHFKMRCI